MGKLYFFNADVHYQIKGKTDVCKTIRHIFKNERVPFSQVKYIFCSDDYLLRINKEFLKHDTLTDIITFNFSGSEEPVQGEVYISIDRVNENAKVYGIKYETEILRVIIHGVLHLCGYLDKRKQDKVAMREKEDFYIKYFNVSREANS